MEKQNIIALELRRIASRNKGMLKPEDVVEAARSEDSPLHSSFTWDDTEAARRYRLEQARHLIRVTVEYLKVNGKDHEVRVFVSLTPDRDESGGYREISAVLNDADYRAQLLRDAFAEMDLFRRKYSALKELSAVFEVMEKTRRKVKK